MARQLNFISISAVSCETDMLGTCIIYVTEKDQLSGETMSILYCVVITWMLAGDVGNLVSTGNNDNINIASFVNTKYCSCRDHERTHCLLA